MYKYSMNGYHFDSEYFSTFEEAYHEAREQAKKEKCNGDRFYTVEISNNYAPISYMVHILQVNNYIIYNKNGFRDVVKADSEDEAIEKTAIDKKDIDVIYPDVSLNFSDKERFSILNTLRSLSRKINNM